MPIMTIDCFTPYQKSCYVGGVITPDITSYYQGAKPLPLARLSDKYIYSQIAIFGLLKTLTHFFSK